MNLSLFAEALLYTLENPIHSRQTLNLLVDGKILNFQKKNIEYPQDIGVSNDTLSRTQ